MSDEITTAETAEVSAPTRAHPENFSREYVSELRAENRTYRKDRDGLEAKVTELQTRLDQIVAENEAKSAEIAQAGRIEIAKARLEALAIKEGIIDTDVLSLLDSGEFAFDDRGRLTNGPDVMDKFKTAKPQLFGSAATASTAKAPPPASTEAKTAKDMSDQEWAAEKRKLGL